MKAFWGILFFFGSIVTAHAQRVCGTVDYLQQLLKDHPSLRDAYNKAQQHTASLGYRPGSNTVLDTTANEVITVPVIIHILYNNDAQNISDAQIMSQLVSLNQDYRRQNSDTSLTPDAFKPFAADAKIMFCLAQVDTQGRRTSGIIRKYTTTQAFLANDAMKYSDQGGDNAWDCTKYLNIWVCNLLGSTLGYAAMPGGPADRDGVVITYDAFGTVGDLVSPYNKGRTASHEIGHWLGLRHLWGDLLCGDDSIADTPTQETYNYGCPSFPHVSSCSPNPNGDMFMDYMDFSDDGCMNMFTIDQTREMRSLFAAGGVRNSFLNAYQCDSNMAQAGPLPVATTVTSADSVSVPVIQIYPNPVMADLTIRSAQINKTSPQSLRIYNTLGVQVFASLLIQSKTTLDISGFTPGVYIVHIGDGSSSFTYKIIHD